MPAIAKYVSAVLQVVVQGYLLLHRCAGGRQVSQWEQGRPQGMVDLQEKPGVWHLLFQGEELRSQGPRCPVLPLRIIESPDPP
jgi:hypothetical protein